MRRVGSGENRIDITYIDNAAEAHLLAAAALTPDSPVGGHAYFISQGEPVNCWQWIDELLALAGLPNVAKSIPLPIAYAAGAALEVTHRLFGRREEPRMTRFLASQLGTSHWFNIARACSDFGYRPSVSTDEGMRRLSRGLG